MLNPRAGFWVKANEALLKQDASQQKEVFLSHLLHKHQFPEGALASQLLDFLFMKVSLLNPFRETLG